MTSAERFPLLLGEPVIMVDGDYSDFSVRRELSVTDKFGGSGVRGLKRSSSEKCSSSSTCKSLSR